VKLRPALSITLLAAVTACTPAGSGLHPAAAAPRPGSSVSAGTIVATLPVGDQAVTMAFDGRYLWVSSTSGVVTQVDTTISQVIRTIKVGGRPAGIAVTAEGVWVADSASATVSRLDLGSGQVNATVRVGAGPVGFAQVDRDLWVFGQSDQRARVLDPRAARVTRTVSLAGLGGGYPAVAGGAIWVPDRSAAGRTVWQIDPASGQVAARVETGAHPAEVAFGFGAGWVTHDEGVSRFDLVGGKELTRITGLGRQVSGLAITPDAVWATSVADNRLSRIDPATNQPVASLEVCTAPRHLTVVGDDIWVVCGDAGMLVRVHPN
jgi:YVTN family beta-propeller protein